MKKIRSSSLLLGKVINQELGDLINVYPIVAPLETKFPFCVYKRVGLQVENTKDIYNIQEEATFEIAVISQSYDESLRIATNVKLYLERLRGNYETSKEEKIMIVDCALVDASENWGNDAYIQNLTFTFKLANEIDVN